MLAASISIAMLKALRRYADICYNWFYFTGSTLLALLKLLLQLAVLYWVYFTGSTLLAKYT